jgi:DNA modification methylase
MHDSEKKRHREKGCVMNYRIINDDVLTGLATLSDESVQCVVTSPPYWGLRDYGTAQWIGGISECDHRENDRRNKRLHGSSESFHGGDDTSQTHPYKELCGKCGAVRVDNQIGLERTPDEYVAKMVEVFRGVRRVLKKDGTCWVNLGDTFSAHKDCKSVPDSLRVGRRSENANIIDKGKSFSRDTKMLKSQGLKNKDLIGIPWMVAFALRADGWYLRQDIIWAKPNPMPESMTDRCTKSHEYIFLLTKNARYYYDAEAIKEQSIDKESYEGRRPRNEGNHNKIDPDNYKFHGSVDENGKLKFGQKYELRNKRSVWEITTKPYAQAHFATFPPEIPEICIKAGTKKGDMVLDPFCGSGTTGEVALRLDRNFIGIELNSQYVDKLARPRMESVSPMFNEEVST